VAIRHFAVSATLYVFYARVVANFIQRYRLSFTLWLVSCCIGAISCGRVAEQPRQREAFRRIVCATPAIVEIVYALGGGDRVAAVSDYTVFPPEALEKPRSGGWMDPNREQLLALRADLVLTQGEHPALAAFAAAHSIPLRSLRIESLEDIPAAAREIGEMLDLTNAAEQVIERMQREWREMEAQRAGRPLVRTALIIGRLPGSMQGMTTVGPGTFLDELLQLAGGTNVFSDATGAYPQISKESLLARNPEVIIEMNPGGWPEGSRGRLEQDWRALSRIDAVRRGRIHFLDEDFLLIPGPRASEIARRLAACLHSEEAP
jgi:iron complex transport system substrate-binding protein